MQDMQVRELIESLSAIEKAAGGAANRNPRLALRNAKKFLSEHSHLSTAALVTQLNDAAPKRRTRKAAAPPTPRVAVVTDYAVRLRRAEGSLSTFSALIDELKKDRRVRKVELAALLKDYAGHTSSFPNKDAAFSIIERTFNDRFMLSQRRA